MEQSVHGGKQAQVLVSGSVFTVTGLICRRNKKISSVNAVLLFFSHEWAKNKRQIHFKILL